MVIEQDADVSVTTDNFRGYSTDCDILARHGKVGVIARTEHAIEVTSPASNTSSREQRTRMLVTSGETKSRTPEIDVPCDRRRLVITDVRGVPVPECETASPAPHHSSRENRTRVGIRCRDLSYRATYVDVS